MLSGGVTNPHDISACNVLLSELTEGHVAWDISQEAVMTLSGDPGALAVTVKVQGICCVKADQKC